MGDGIYEIDMARKLWNELIIQGFTANYEYE